MRSDKLTPLLLVGLLVVQTLLLGILIFRVNALHALILSSGPIGGPTGPGPADVVENVDPGSGPKKGADGAPVTIVEFSDFTCPACSDLQPILRRILADHEGDVQLAFRYFPLSFQGKPFRLATAAECAHRQGAFWQLHDVLFAESVEMWSEQELVTEAGQLGLDEEAFAACMASEEVTTRLREDFEAGRGYGVSSTPTLFVNGRRVRGADATALERAIEASREGSEQAS